MNSVARVFLDVHMGMNFDGLSRLMIKEKVDIRKMGVGAFVIFLNRKCTAFKILAGNSYLVYYKNKNRRIPIEAIRYLPASFGGNEFEFNKAVEKSLRSKIKYDSLPAT